MRTRMPKTRIGKTHSVRIGNSDMYFTVNEGADGRPREIMAIKYRADHDDPVAITYGRQTEFYLNMWSIAVSMALQCNAELMVVCKKFMHQDSEDGGLTNDDEIKNCKSTIDFIAKWLWLKYGDGSKI